MTYRTFALVVTHTLGVLNALVAIASISDGSYGLAALNTVAMLYISTTKIPPREE